MITRILPVLGLAVCACALWPAPGRAADPIGLVKTLTGTASVSRSGNVQPLAAGNDVFRDDVVTTGPDGSLGITFRDDTTLSMGPKGRMALDDFAFDPAKDDVRLGVRLLKGTFAMASGQIAKLAPDNVAVKTPVMSIGIRGTTFLVEVAGDE
ncbi:MAG: FecR domain-containing protein [Magnetospirillum sp.]|nr:FecR domain-containing protein [Magnetospirillum sp.]